MGDQDDERTGPDIAAWGLASAAAVVERMLELGRAGAAGLRLTFPANGAAPGTGEASTAADPAARAKEARRFRADAERLVELYADWTRMLLDGVATVAEQAVGVEAPSVDEAGALLLGPAPAGGQATTVAWLHVLDGPAAPSAELHASDLVAHDGRRVPGAAVRCLPGAVDTSVPRRSTEVQVVVEIPVDAAAGVYHGHLLAKGLPEIALALRLEVGS